MHEVITHLNKYVYSKYREKNIHILQREDKSLRNTRDNIRCVTVEFSL